jgi:anti-sigma factor RsiW
MNDEQLSDLVKKHATRHQLSDSVRASIRTQIALQQAATPTAKPAKTKPVSIWTNFWPKASVGFAFGVCLTLFASWLAPRMLIEHSIPKDLVAGYVRSLSVGPLIEIASTDRHNVKPWFLGKLEFAPPVYDLDSQGFPLLGARVEQLQGSKTAVLSYSKDKHVISVFIWPSAGVEISQAMRRNGFQIRQWTQSDMQLWAVSDVEAVELERFVSAWQSQLKRGNSN